MYRGYVKLWRKTIDNPMACNPNYLALWVHLLFLAAHKDEEFIFQGTVKVLSPGQILTGRKKLSDLTGISETCIERILSCYEKCGQITQQTHSKFRIISILNWKEYQEETDSTRTTRGQHADNTRTHTNIKKNDKEELHSAGGETKPYELKTWVDKIIFAYKVIKAGLPEDLTIPENVEKHREWDRFNYKRCLRAAESLKAAFSDPSHIGTWLEQFSAVYGQKKLDWTLDTAAKKAWETKQERENEISR